MDIYNTRFTVHADYIDPGVTLSVILILIASIVGIVLLIAAFLRIKNYMHEGLPAAVIMIITGILLIAVSQSLYPYRSIEDNQAPAIDEVIAAPEGCSITSNRVIKAEGSSVADINLPDGQKRATYEVEASCQDNEALDGLNTLNNTIIFLDQQPLAVAS